MEREMTVRKYVYDRKGRVVMETITTVRDSLKKEERSHGKRKSNKRSSKA